MDAERFCRWCRDAVARCGIDWFGRHADLDGEQIHYVEAGSGDPVVLVHGFMAWSYTWRQTLPALAGQHRVLALDLRGFGLSEKRRDRGHAIEDQVDLLRRFLDALQVERSVLVGHSMGGEVSLRFALRHPERVRGMVLVSSSGYVVREQPALERLALRTPFLGELFVQALALNRRFAGNSLRTAYRAPERVRATDVEAYLLPARVPGAAGAFIRMLRDADFGRAARELRQIETPSLVVWGENDPWVPLTHGQRLAGELRNSRLVVFPECGHVPPEEYPAEFNHLVAEFLKGLAD